MFQFNRAVDASCGLSCDLRYSFLILITALQMSVLGTSRIANKRSVGIHIETRRSVGFGSDLVPDYTEKCYFEPLAGSNQIWYDIVLKTAILSLWLDLAKFCTRLY